MQENHRAQQTVFLLPSWFLIESISVTFLFDSQSSRSSSSYVSIGEIRDQEHLFSSQKQTLPISTPLWFVCADVCAAHLDACLLPARASVACP